GQRIEPQNWRWNMNLQWASLTIKMSRVCEMPVIAECATALCRIGKPVLVLDTCVLLDIVRIPLRYEKDSHARNSVAAATTVLSQASSQDPSLSLVIPPL